MVDRAPTMQDIEIIRNDIRDIYNRLNENTSKNNEITAKNNEVLTELKVQIARLAEAMNNSKPLPRPCEQFKYLEKEFDSHINEQKQNTKIWKSAIVSELVKYAFMGATIIISIYYTTKGK